MVKYTIIQFVVIVTATLALSVQAFADDPGLIINEDNSHFYTSRSAEKMTLEGLNAFVDQYADTQVSHLFLSLNSMKSSFASQSREAIWELGDQEMPEGAGKRWMDNARLLHERGLDPYAIWIARSREKGISPWVSMRMNDLHDVPNVKSYMHSTFWVEHPEFWRVPNDTSGGYTNRALDFGHPEVREYAMAFVREILERYDPDGLEIDWMRFGWHFKAGEEALGAEHLTVFMREVRQLTQEWSKKRGHPIKLSARVPAHPDAAKGLGMDGVRWAKEGLVDMLTPCPFWTTTDFDIPVELWKERISDATAQVMITPGIEHNTRAYGGAAPIPNDMAMTRGFAASAWHRGADQLYLFNYMDSETRPVSASDYRVLVEDGLKKNVVYRQARRHVQTFRDTVPAGFDAGVKLPAQAKANPVFMIHVGKKPAQGTVTVIAGLAKGDGLAEARLELMINGKPGVVIEDYTTPGQFPGVVRAVQFNCPLESVNDGYNELKIQLSEGSDQKIVWLEIRMGE